MRRRSHPAGLSLIELLIVITLIAVIVGFSIPRIDFVGFEVQGAVKQVSTSLMAAQRTAVKKQHDVVVAFDRANGVIRIHEDANNNRKIDDGEPVRTLSLSEHAGIGRATAPALSTIGSDPISFVRTQDDLPVVVFSRSGSASEHGGIYITSRRGLDDAGLAGDDYAVEVDRATGRVSWYRFSEDEGWKRGF